ncbi:TIGR02117 family protein [Roseibium sp. MMSF_3544]|uniref:TIGR02117 family protein n=1 Tax=unclassified Roseibium TaxID=2629323 RepID=UPI00273FD0AE|nr:TIGR02117 family protein [Roseibium sp. MMSF_3544]
MRPARIARSILVWFLLLAATLTIIIGLGTLVPRPFSFSAETGEPGTADQRRILVLTNPIHTDIALPADPDVLEALSFVSEEGLDLDYTGVFWIIIGWGGRSFYIETPTWADLKPGPVIDALTWDRSVMHVRRAGQISPSNESVRAIDLNNAEFDALLNGIQRSFEPGEEGRPRSIQGAAYDAHDIFFPAKGGFNALMGCNTWTARMLRISGVRTGLWTPLPFTLNWSLDLHNAGRQASPATE